MAATSFEPLILRIEEILADGAGANRTLGSGDRFRRGVFPEQDESTSARLALAHGNDRAMWASYASMEPAGTSDGISDKRRVSATVEVFLVYYTGHHQRHADLRDTAVRAANDVRRVAAALEWPENVQQDNNGDDTGLAGGLRWESWSFTGPSENDKRATATMVFSTEMVVTQP